MTTTVTRTLAGALFVLAALAHGEGPHFTFTVPVVLQDLPPEITGYRVSCVTAQRGTSGIIARGDYSGTISGGAVNTEVTLPLTASGAFADPAAADEYRCSLHLIGNIDGASVVFMDDANVRFPLAPGAPYNRSVRGSLP